MNKSKILINIDTKNPTAPQYLSTTLQSFRPKPISQVTPEDLQRIKRRALVDK